MFPSNFYIPRTNSIHFDIPKRHINILFQLKLFFSFLKKVVSFWKIYSSVKSFSCTHENKNGLIHSILLIGKDSMVSVAEIFFIFFPKFFIIYEYFH
ncbi:conserved hypothetical protein [Oenococcus oeni]|nr:conserved hypothetical protein [Oenococcus oeni]